MGLSTYLLDQWILTGRGKKQVFQAPIIFVLLRKCIMTDSYINSSNNSFKESLKFLFRKQWSF